MAGLRFPFDRWSDGTSPLATLLYITVSKVAWFQSTWNESNRGPPRLIRNPLVNMTNFQFSYIQNHLGAILPSFYCGGIYSVGPPFVHTSHGGACCPGLKRSKVPSYKVLLTAQATRYLDVQYVPRQQPASSWF